LPIAPRQLRSGPCPLKIGRQRQVDQVVEIAARKLVSEDSPENVGGSEACGCAGAERIRRRARADGTLARQQRAPSVGTDVDHVGGSHRRLADIDDDVGVGEPVLQFDLVVDTAGEFAEASGIFACCGSHRMGRERRVKAREQSHRKIKAGATFRRIDRGIIEGQRDDVRRQTGLEIFQPEVCEHLRGGRGASVEEVGEGHGYSTIAIMRAACDAPMPRQAPDASSR
jgi:hypothetical protein